MASIKTLQLAPSLENMPSVNPGPNDIFYKSKDLYYPIPKNLKKAILCSNPDGTGDTSVDDKIIITWSDSDGDTDEGKFTHDYSSNNSGVITPIPPKDLTTEFLPLSGKNITIETSYTDLFPGHRSATNFYLYLEYETDLTVEVEIEGHPSIQIAYSHGMNVQQALEVAYDKVKPKHQLSFSLEYYGKELGYMVIMLDNKYDKGDMYWNLSVNKVSSPTGIDSTILHSGDNIKFTYEKYSEVDHKGTTVEAKHKLKHSRL